MIFGLTPVQSVQAILNQIAKIEFNALLQMGIEVIEAKEGGRYLIRMGRHTFETRSDQPLLPGRAYWAQMNQTQEGVIHLHRLHPKPLLLQKENFFEPSLLQKLARSANPAESFKEMIMHKMAHAPTKEQFQNLTALLISMHHGVLSIPIRHRGRRSLLQMRKKSSNDSLNQKSVEFYAALTNLGPIEGKVVRHETFNKAILKVYYDKSADFLKHHTDELEGFAQIEIIHQPGAVSAFWDGEGDSLLDVKG